MATVSYQISNLLEKMTSSDKDFRFMATNDLMTELQKDSIKLDDDSERKVVKMLLKLLEDKNGEVQNLAVKCLGPLVNKVKEYQVETIVDALCANMVSDKEQLRDISSIGLKTVISELPLGSNALAANVCKRITGRLSNAIEKQEDVPVQLEALDIVADLLSRFGSLLVTFHSVILAALLPQLSSPRQAVRKRTIVALSHLLTSSNSQLYNKLLDHLVEVLSTNKDRNVTRTYIQCVASICRQAGHRFGEHIERIMPLIVQYSTEDDDELREYCLQAFEAFVYRCPKEITLHINKIIKICLTYIIYDPNYNYDDDENDGSDGEGVVMETEEDGEEDAEDEYSDDDDMSWKVRRASAKCLEAVVSSRRELLSEFYKIISPALIARFKEREENVKSDIFHAYITLLRQTKPATGVSLDPDSMEDEEGPITLLQQQVPLIVKAVHRQMKEKSIKTRQDCLSLLKELVLVLPGALTNHIPALIPGIQFSLGEKNSSSNMKIDTLAFVHTLLITHHPEAFHAHMTVLAPPIIAAVGDPFYKITAEALLVLQELVQVIRPHDKPYNLNFTSLSTIIYRSTLMRLRTADIDQEVKERAIACMGQILAHLGDTLDDELKVCLPIFLDRLRNEITRLTTVKALTCIAASPLRVDLKPIMEDAIPVLGSFLRKNQRALKLCSLTLLDTLVQNYSSALNPDLLDKVTAELPSLLNETDLHIAQLTLTLLTTIAKLHPVALTRVSDNILPEILVLVKSPLLQGAALNSMLEFFQALVQAGIPGLGYRELLSMLVAPVNIPQLHKQAYHSLAKCAAALTIMWQQEALGVVEQFLKDVQNPQSDARHIFALLVIGEIGRHVDLSNINSLKLIILNSFSAHSEEVKQAASYTLGNIAVGNLPEYLPFILKEIEAQPKRQYLLLHSLKEIITCQSASPSGVSHLQNFVPSIWMLLYRHCECTEEGTRNVVAECLGKLTLIDPATLLPKLQESLKSSSALMRTTVVTAVKFTISDQPQPIDPMLKLCMGSFLASLEDPDLNVRRVALVAFNSAAHNKPMLVRDLLDSVLPKLYAETMIKKELIREVEMGPFKHTVDDGLDLRKAAFECMYTLLDSCLDRLDVFDFLNHVENGLRDHYDIKMLTYLMTARLAQLCPTAVLQRLERLVEPLKSTCTMKVKANSVKQEYEKQDELKRSALRAVAALLTISDAAMVDRKIAFTLLFGYNQVLENLILLLVSQNLNHLRNIMREIVMLQEQIVENISVFLNTYYYESLLKIDRSVWMRERSCVWWETIVPQFEYEDWIENFRMSQQTFEYICSAVEKNLQPKFNPLKSREPVSVKKQVAIAIFTYASCCEFRVVGHLFGVHKATVWKCVHRVTKEINEVLMPIWITMPNEEECQLISEEFKKKTGMPCFIGAVDGSHIPITPPSVGYRDFINRKGYASFVLQGLVDHRSVFRNINIESPGCNHDANVFKHSALFIHYEQLICQARRLINGVSIPYLVMGDPAYPLLPWLIKGFTKHQELSAVEESFNAYLNSGRVSVEIAFGRLKGRWRRISKRIDCHYTFVPNMVSACCVLHNIVEHRQEKFNKQWDDRAKRNKVIFPDTTTEEDTEPEIQAGIPMGAVEDGKKIRNVLLKIVSELPLRKMLH